MVDVGTLTDAQWEAQFGTHWRTFKAEHERMEKAKPIVEELQAKDPLLPVGTALTMAFDRLSKEYATERLDAGDPWMKASVFIGSYNRLEWIVERIEEGRIDEAEVYPHLCEIWRGSDPDDTDPRFLALWQRAKAAKGIYLRDGKALPSRGVLDVYRGQDAGAPLGIAWSLDKNIATKFARGAATRQANRGGTIWVCKVRRKSVLGFNTGRGESEVILDPLDLV